MYSKNNVSQNSQPHASTLQLIMTIGSFGHGKSTINNALLGESKCATSDNESSVTQNFDQHTSTLECFNDVVFTDSPGLNDPSILLTSWIEQFNTTVRQENGPELSLVVLLIKAQLRPELCHCSALATLLSCVTELRAKNFVVIFN